MTALTPTAHHWIQAFSWMLLHSLWQGVLLAICAAFLLIATRNTRAALRYNLLLSLFALFLAGCATTFVHEWHIATNYPGVAVWADLKTAKPGWLPVNVYDFVHTSISYFSANAPLVALIWFVLFLFRAVKLMNGLVYMQRIKERNIFEPSAGWQSIIGQLCRKLGVERSVQLLESGYVKVPVVIGYLKPVILVPVGILAGMPAGQVEAVLLHELAHIRRNDYLVNLVQTLAETVFFFNPALLWLSAQLRDERENCCDDIALVQMQNERAFIEALIAFKQHALNYQVAFAGPKNQLLKRVSRIVNGRNEPFPAAGKTYFLTGFIALFAMTTTIVIGSGGVISAPMVKVEAPVTHLNQQASTAVSIRKKIDVVHSRRRQIHPKQLHQADSKAIQFSPTVRHDPNQVTVNQQQAIRDAEQAKRNEEQLARNDTQALRNREQDEHNKEQAKLNAPQAQRNEQQARLNAKQAERNREQDDRNKQQAKQNALQARLNEGRQMPEQNIMTPANQP